MKILLINMTYGHGSTGNIVRTLKSSLERKGHQVFIAYGFFERIKDRSFFKTVHGTGVLPIKFRLLWNRVTGTSGLTNRWKTRALCEWIKKVSPDVVNLHNIHGDFVFYPKLLGCLAQLGVPVVLTLHDCWSFTGQCPYFDLIACYKWRSRCEKCTHFREIEYPRSWFFDRTKKAFLLKSKLFSSIKDLVLVSPSKWLLSLALESPVFRGRDGYVIPNGIDWPFAEHIRNACSTKIRILGVASSWTKRKGLDSFLAMAKHHSDALDITLVGKFPKKILQLYPNIHFLSRTSTSEELVHLYQTSDVFVNPTLEDNFPTCTLESLFCGTPVVVYKTGGAAEPIIDGINGYSVTQNDTKALFEAIEKAALIKDASQVQKSASLYKSDVFAQKYEQLYENITNSKTQKNR